MSISDLSFVSLILCFRPAIKINNWNHLQFIKNIFIWICYIPLKSFTIAIIYRIAELMRSLKKTEVSLFTISFWHLTCSTADWIIAHVLKYILHCYGAYLKHMYQKNNNNTTTGKVAVKCQALHSTDFCFTNLAYWLNA